MMLKKITLLFTAEVTFHLLLFFCAFLPIQFALNPVSGIDLPIARIIALLVFFHWLIVIVRGKKVVRIKSVATFLVIMFIGCAIASIFLSNNVFWSLRKILFLLSFFPLYFVTISIANTYKKQRAIIIAFLGGATVLALVGILQFLAQFIFGIDATYSFFAHYIAPFFLGNSFSQSVLTYPSWLVSSAGSNYMRAIAVFPDPHMLSYYLGMLLPWSIALWVTTKTHKKMLLSFSALLFLTDIATFTRGGYIALLVSIVAILPLVSMSSAKKLLGAAAAILFIFMIAPNTPVADRFASSFDSKEGSNEARISNWEQALSVIAKNPLGVGIGSYSLAVDPSADYRKPIYAHNVYLDLTAELGLHSAIIFIALLITSGIYFWKKSKENLFFVAGVASVVIFATHSLVENPLYSVHVLPLIIIILAIGTTTSLYEKIPDAE